jgi:hypothetical protein
MRAQEFLIEKAPTASVSNKLNFIKTKIDSGDVTDPKTVDYIYKILQKPEIQQAITAHLNVVMDKDADVSAFQKKNNNMLADVIRKLPVPKEKLDQFVTRWAKGKGFVNVDMLQSGNRGTLQQLIPDPIAFVAFETFEKLRSQVSLHKRGTAGYGEFGLAMLSPFVSLKAPGDIQVNGTPIEVKGNDARLYADERTGIGEDLEEAPIQSVPQNTQINKNPKQVNQPAPVTPKRGSAPGALNNVLTGIINNDANTINQAAQALTARGVRNANGLIKNIQRQGEAGYELLATAWWKAGFTAYQKAIQMPIMVIGFGQFLISDNAEDFVNWGCLPKTPTNYGYMYGRQVGQSRETYPKIFVPGHNK